MVSSGKKVFELELCFVGCKKKGLAHAIVIDRIPSYLPAACIEEPSLGKYIFSLLLIFFLTQNSVKIKTNETS